MDRSVKAALLSALVFPGVGQLFLKRPGRAMVFLVPALAAGAYFANSIMGPVMAIALEISTGQMPFDPWLIQARVEQTRIDTASMNGAALVLIVAWVAATLDAWLLGRAPAPGKQQ